MICFSSFAVELIIWEIVLLVNSNNLRKVDYFSALFYGIAIIFSVLID